MSERRQQGNQSATMRREDFLRNPSAALKRAEAQGSLVIIEENGEVHAVISDPSDDRPIIVG